MGATWGTASNYFGNPEGVCVDALGNIYVADTDNHRVCIWSSVGVSVGWFGGGMTGLQTGDAPSSSTTDFRGFNWPMGVWFAGTTLYVADSGNHRICKWNPVVASPLGWIGGGSDGWKATSGANSSSDYQSFDSPTAVCVSGTDIFVAEQWNYRVSRWTD
jgi:sugar lactone lactonase YvrE